MSTEKRLEREIVQSEFPAFNQMLERFLDFNRWGFQKTFSGLSTHFPPSIIYDSELCRVRFLWPVKDIRDREVSISILYGRSHAPNDEKTLLWNGEQCFCWHTLNLVLEFLDGLSPERVVRKNYELPAVMKQFNDSKNPSWSQREWLVRMHATIWEHYGERFFQLFDMRHLDLWENYVHFVKEFRMLKEAREHYGGPWPSNIC